jgi:hypothetical protein
MSAAIIFAMLLVLMLTGMPVSISLGLTVLTFLFTMTDVPVESVALKLFTGIEKFEIMAIPFFILAGNFLTHGGVAKRMINFATSLVGHFHGGLGMGGVVACGLFAAVSGSSPATVAAIGAILLPAMVKQGFPMKFGAGIVASSGALGILIPPSIVMVMYAVSTNSSIGALFMAGVIPGAVLLFMLGFTTWWYAKKNNYPRMAKAPVADRIKAFRESFWGLMLIVVVMGGIYTGIFTPTEAAAMSAVYAFIVAVFVYRDLPLAHPEGAARLGQHECDAAVHHHQRHPVLLPADIGADSAGGGGLAGGQRIGGAGLPAGGEHPAAAGRQHHGAVVHHPDHGAHPVSGGDGAGHRSGALRHHHHGEHGNRHDHAAGRPQPVCRQRHRETGHDRHDQGRDAVADHHDRRS